MRALAWGMASAAIAIALVAGLAPAADGSGREPPAVADSPGGVIEVRHRAPLGAVDLWLDSSLAGPPLDPGGTRRLAVAPGRHLLTVVEAGGVNAVGGRHELDVGAGVTMLRLGGAAVTFLDVTDRPDSPTFAPEFAALAWAGRHGIARGWDRGDGTAEFRPRAQLSREALAAFLHRLAGAPRCDARESRAFLDVAASHPFAEAICWLGEEGIATGWTVSDGAEFRPGEPVRRDALAAFLHRFARGCGAHGCGAHGAVAHRTVGHRAVGHRAVGHRAVVSRAEGVAALHRLGPRE